MSSSPEDSQPLGNSSNSFYASFKIYINKINSQKKSSSENPQPQILRIEQIDCEQDDEVFLAEDDLGANVEVQIKVEPPEAEPGFKKESSPVFYLEPENWSDLEVATPPRGPSPCGCGKAHPNQAQMEALPEESIPNYRRAFSTSSCLTIPTSPGRRLLLHSNSLQERRTSSSGSFSPLSSPRAAIMSELVQQQTRQRKIAIPVICARVRLIKISDRIHFS